MDLPVLIFVQPVLIMMYGYILLIAVMKILNLIFLLEQPVIVMIASWCATKKCGKS